jgi:hypothetical protein
MPRGNRVSWRKFPVFVTNVFVFGTSQINWLRGVIYTEFLYQTYEEENFGPLNVTHVGLSSRPDIHMSF